MGVGLADGWVDCMQIANAVMKVGVPYGFLCRWRRLVGWVVHASFPECEFDQNDGNRKSASLKTRIGLSLVEPSKLSVPSSFDHRQKVNQHEASIINTERYSHHSKN